MHAFTGDRATRHILYGAPSMNNKAKPLWNNARTRLATATRCQQRHIFQPRIPPVPPKSGLGPPRLQAAADFGGIFCRPAPSSRLNAATRLANFRRGPSAAELPAGATQVQIALCAKCK